MTDKRVKIIFWIIYISLLAVLLPHTAWAFSQYEATNNTYIAWLAAITFECAIAVCTKKLTSHIDKQKNYKSFAKRMSSRYLNASGAGLFVFVAVSTRANIMHAVHFANPDYASSIDIIAFGGVLPFASLLFARILSDASDVQEDDNEEVKIARKKISELARKLQEAQTVQSELASLQSEFATVQDELARLQSVFATLNENMQAAARYNAGHFATLQEAASAAGVSESTISRLARSLNGS